MTQATALDQIDFLLSAWDERLRRMDENLVALESEAIYQILAGKAGKRPALEGVTKERVGPALDAVTELFENRERLAGVVAKAKEVRETISTLTFWDTDEKIAEIYRLLRGTSIELGQQIVALRERNLLDVGTHDVLIDPEQLLALMAKRFGEARTVLLSVSTAWEALDAETAGIEKEMADLRALAADLHAPGSPLQPEAFPELADAEAELARLRARVAKDPLGVQGGVDQRIVPRVAALRAKLEAERGARSRATAALDDARSRRRDLADLHARAVRAADEARSELAGESVARLPAVLDEGLLTGLDDWLRKLEGTVGVRRWSSAEVGLMRWRATADEHRAVDAAAVTAAESLLARRGELAGRLSARRAQAAALAARGTAIDPSFEAHAREADALLRRRPVPIDVATRAVEAYEAALVAQRSKKGG